MCWTWRSRCVGEVSAVSLGTSRGTRRHDHGSLGVTRGDVGVDAFSIVPAVPRDRGYNSRNLVEQAIDLGTVVHLLGRERGGDDLTRSGIEADVQLPPRPARAGAVFLNQPLASPHSFSPVLSTSRCKGAASPPASVLGRDGRGTSSVAERRLRVVWSGTRSASPSRSTMEPTRPSVCRNAKRNTARSVSPVRIARGEYQGCLPRVARGSAAHAAIASSLNHTVKLPRWRNPAS